MAQNIRRLALNLALSPMRAASWHQCRRSSSNESLGLKVTLLGAGVNLMAGLAKLVAGYACGSSALVSDGAHSLSDLLTDGVALATYRASREPPDEEHPFGHGKIEAAGACAVGGALLLAGGSAGLHAGSNMWVWWTGESAALVDQHEVWAPAALVAIGSIAAKEYLYRVTKAVGDREQSSVLIANAYHHRSDALSSVASLIGVTGAALCHPLCDYVAGLGVALMVADSGRKVAMSAIDELLDKSVDPALLDRLRLVRVPGAQLSSLRARKSGPRLIIDATLKVGANLTASAAHQLGEHAKQAILQKARDDGFKVHDLLLHLDPEDRQELDDVSRLLPTPDQVEDQLRRTLATLTAAPPVYSNLAVHYTPYNTVAAVLDLRFPPHLSIRAATARAKSLRKTLLLALPILAELHLKCDLNARSAAPVPASYGGTSLHRPANGAMSRRCFRPGRHCQRRRKRLT